MNKTKFLSIFKNIWFLWAVALLFDIITFLVIFYKIHPSKQTLALHYNVLVGVEWYGKGYNLYFIPGVGLLLGVANFILWKYLKHSEKFLPFLAAFMTLCLETILLASALFLVKVN